MEFLTIRSQTCPHPDCFYYGQSLRGNVQIHSRRQARFKCKGCGKTWVAHRGAFHYKLRSEPGKIDRVLELLKFGQSVRRVAALLHVSPSTVQRWKSKSQFFIS